MRGPMPAPTDSSHRYTVLELLAIMKEQKLTHLKLGGMELTMDPAAWAPAPLPTDFEMDRTNMPTDDEMLFWSVPAAFDEAEEKAEAGA